MQQAPQVKTLLVKRQQQILFETEETFTLQTHDILILEGHLQQLKTLKLFHIRKRTRKYVS